MILDIKFLEYMDELFELKQWPEIMDDGVWSDQLHRTKVILLLMQIHGLSLSGKIVFNNGKPLGKGYQGINRRDEVTLSIKGEIFKFLIRCAGETPFYIENNRIMMAGIDTGIITERVSDVSNNRDNGYYFPMLNGKIDKKVMRINPRNTGKCPGRCFYCQRMYYLPTENELEKRRVWNPVDIVDKAIMENGDGVFSSLDSILVVTELYGSPSKYIDFCRAMKTLAVDNGFSGRFEALAQEIRTAEDVKEFSGIVDGGVFVYTLECFSNRSEHMSKYKALDMEEVYNILGAAKEFGMSNTVINYIMGIDEIGDFIEGIERLVENSPINGIGLNVYYPYSEELEKIRVKGSSCLKYYGIMINKVNQLGLNVHQPTDYERCPAIYKI